MNDHVIYAPSEEEVRSGFLSARMREFNYRVIGTYGEAQMVRLNMRGPGDEVTAGVRGFVFLGWLQIDILWVAEAFRGQGLGTRILAAAEEKARELGACGGVVNTFEWQAAPFYEKQGCREFGKIDDYVKGQALRYLSKRWDGEVQALPRARPLGPPLA